MEKPDKRSFSQLNTFNIKVLKHGMAYQECHFTDAVLTEIHTTIQ